MSEKVKVRIISKEGNRVLVQYPEGDLPVRKIVEVSQIENGYIEAEILASSDKVGLDWMSLPPCEISAEQIAETLLRFNVFDENDLEDVKKIRSAAYQLGKMVLSSIKESLSKE